MILKFLPWVLLPILICSTDLIAQTSTDPTTIFTKNDLKASAINDLLFKCRPSLESETASTYLFEDWQEGVLISQDNRRFEVKGQYDITKDELLVFALNKSHSIYNHEIKIMKLADHYFLNVEYQDNGLVNSSIMELVSEGKFDLFCKKGVNQKGDIESTLYVKHHNGPANLLGTKKADLANFFSSKGVNLDQILKTKKYNLKKTNDVIQLFQYYNGVSPKVAG